MSLIEELKRSIETYDIDAAVRTAKEIVKSGLDPLKAFEEGLSAGIEIVGDKYGAGEIFLPELIMASEAMKDATAILEAAIPKGTERKSLGKILIGTVEGDVHDIGKNIVVTMLRANGFVVHDVGVDVPTQRFIEEAKRFKPDIMGLSALMTTTALNQKDIIQESRKQGLTYKIIVGGAATSKKWAEEIGADGHGADSIEAVELAKTLMEGM